MQSKNCRSIILRRLRTDIFWRESAMSDVTIVKPETTGTEIPSQEAQAQEAQPKKRKKKSKDEKIKALQHSANNWQAKYHRAREELVQMQQERDEAIAKLAEYAQAVRERDEAVARVEELMQRLSQYYK